jgi:hypothetical protein
MKIAYVFLIVVLLCGCNSGEQEIIVVPPNYEGYILIFFNQRDGNPVKYEGNKRVYEIPKNGVLKTQFKGNYGNVGFAEYYYGKIGKKYKIPSIVSLNEASNSIAGFRGGNGTVRRSNNSEIVEFSEFYIGTKTKIQHYQQQAENVDVLKLLE